MSVEKTQAREDFAPLPRCQAYSRQKGVQCQKKAVNGKRVCRYHGGLSPSGPDHPSWKTGKYSKYLPTDLLQKVKEANADPDFLSLREEIKLIDARLMQLLDRVDVDGGSANWRNLNAAWRRLNQATRDGDQNLVQETIREINDIIQRGLHDTMIWIDIQNTIESRRRLTQSESKMLVARQQMISSERAMNLIILLADIVRNKLEDYQKKEKKVDGKLIISIGEELRSLTMISNND